MRHFAFKKQPPRDRYDGAFTVPGGLIGASSDTWSLLHLT